MLFDESGAMAAEADTRLRAELAALLPELRAFARFLVRGRGEADDLVQDAVVRALGALEQFQPGTNLKAWLFTILRNTFYEQGRRRSRETAMLRNRLPEEEVSDPHRVNSTDLADLSRLLWTLPPVLREALVLVGAQELSHEEAAAICGVPVGTMKARVSRGRARLAGLMAGQEMAAAK
jgi:RNA polymerase sigma-70 factor (ECF subfamily)